MASLAQLVASPTLSSSLGYVARPHRDPTVERVALIEDLGEVERVGEHAVVLLTDSASAAAGSYRFDVALRVARSRTVAAFVVSAADVTRITPTAAAVADRSGTAILARGPSADLAQLTVALARELAGEADAAMLRAHAALRAIEAHPDDGGVPGLVAHAGAALGVPLALADTELVNGPRAAVVVDDRVELWVTAPEQEGDLALAVDIVLRVAAAAVQQRLTRARRAEELPIASRADVLTELLSAPLHGRPPLVQRARDLGVGIDGWHVAIRLDFEDLADTDAADELATYAARLDLARAALAKAQTAGGTWHSARAGTALVLLRMYVEDPGVGAAADVATTMDGVLEHVRGRLPTTVIRCGVGSAHQGPAGLVSSVAEAKAAATAARTSGRAHSALPFDSVGLRRTLVEWYASDIAQDAVATILAPLAKVGDAKAERLIQTLHVFLDQQGSLTRTAERLSLHRNAVAYRVDQIFALLEVDRHNPDDLLLLQLACRARELS